MARELNLQNKEKRFLTLTLFDGEKVLITTPTKELYAALKNFEENTKSKPIEEQLEQLDELMSEIISNNLAKKKFTVEYVKQNFELEDEQLIVETYGEFVAEARNNPN